MATSSIYKSISVKTPKGCIQLLRALEHSKKNTPNQVAYERSVRELTRDQIREIFGESK